jgi:DNA-binding CsgD family transcriptional regulator
MKTQLKFTESALDLLEAEAPQETFLIALCVHIVALLLRELAQRGALARLERLEKRLPWTDGLEPMHFQVLRTIGWSYALNSEFVPALTNIARAAMLLGDPISRLYAHLDRATVSIFALERTGAQADFATAQGLLKKIDWKSLRTEGLAVLPLAAATAAELQLTREARSLLALAESTQAQMAPYWALAHGPRMRGFIAESKALTEAGHNHKAAIESARRAFAIFDDIGYQWRSGRMATLLLTLTGEKTWRAEAERALAGYSRSPFASALADQTRSELTVRQQEVLRLTLEGKSGAQIAEALDISIYTVYNHQAEIKRVKGARTVTALVASDGGTKRKRARKAS